MKRPREGWEGWDDYAPFYDWENTRTQGRDDVPFWRRLALEARGRVLELGCGTGRISRPLARAGVRLVGIDRSAPMLARLRAAWQRTGSGKARRRTDLRAVRGDIRALPFAPGRFEAAIGPYGVLQSLLTEADLTATLESVARVVAPGGTFGIELVPDVPKWREYSDRMGLRGRAGRGVHLTLIESVRQDRRRRLTMFDQRYIERRNGRSSEHRFELTFRTLSIRQMKTRLERAGFAVERVMGDYDGTPWHPRADVWILMARRKA